MQPASTNPESPRLPLSELSEDQLVELAKQRDEGAFAELMRRNSSPSFRLALSVLKDRQEAEDQVQNSFFNAWKNLDTFQQTARFSTWFRTIVVNQCLMRLRKLRRAKLVYMEDTADEDGPKMELASTDENAEMNLGREQMAAAVRIEIQRMPPILREVLVLRDIEQKSTADTALALDISEAAVKSRLLRAREMLKERMEKHR